MLTRDRSIEIYVFVRFVTCTHVHTGYLGIWILIILSLHQKQENYTNIEANVNPNNYSGNAEHPVDANFCADSGIRSKVQSATVQSARWQRLWAQHARTIIWFYPFVFSLSLSFSMFPFVPYDSVYITCPCAFKNQWYVYNAPKPACRKCIYDANITKYLVLTKDEVEQGDEKLKELEMELQEMGLYDSDFSLGDILDDPEEEQKATEPIKRRLPDFPTVEGDESVVEYVGQYKKQCVSRKALLKNVKERLEKDKASGYETLIFYKSCWHGIWFFDVILYSYEIHVKHVHVRSVLLSWGELRKDLDALEKACSDLDLFYNNWRLLPKKKINNNNNNNIWTWVTLRWAPNCLCDDHQHRDWPEIPWELCQHPATPKGPSWWACLSMTTQTGLRSTSGLWFLVGLPHMFLVKLWYSACTALAQWPRKAAFATVCEQVRVALGPHLDWSSEGDGHPFIIW